VEFFKTQTHIDFMGKRLYALALSVGLLIASLVSFVVQGLNFGIDFTGGTLVEVGYREPVELNGVRDALQGAGFESPTVQHFGTAREVLIRLAPRADVSQAQLSDQAFAALKQAAGDQIELRRVEFVGPQVGEHLAEQGFLALLAALGAILVYVGVRFEFRFALGAILAMAHDALLVVGVFSLFGLSFDLTVLASVLAVIGYSINDTIVVYDRIREVFREKRKLGTVEAMNLAVNQTLSRTIMTGVTTLMVLGVLLAFGGEMLFGFALALILGILIGTFSSIYVASPLALVLGVSREHLAVVKKEGEELDARP
jgi:preprotein translocase subunit SecF